MKIGSGYFFNFYNELSLRVMQNVRNDVFLLWCSFYTVLHAQNQSVLVNTALIIINDNLCYAIV